MADGTIARYIKNISRSFGYAAVDKFKEIAPAPVEFVETNSSFFKEIRDTTRKLASTNLSRTSSSIKASKAYNTADKAIRNVFDDLKSGNFYNKEREMAAGESMFNDDDSWSDTNWDNLDDDSRYLGGMMDEVGAKSTRAVVNTVARTANAITENIKASTTLAHSQNIRMYGLVQRGMEAIAENTGSLVEYANTVGRAHVENSQKFYEASTALQNKQVELLEKIYNEIHVDEKKKSSRNHNDELNFSSVAGSGIPDLKEYMKLLKKKGSNAVSGSALGMVQGMGPEFIDMMIASPLKFVPQYMVTKMISKNAEKLFEEFNQTISGLFGTTMMKLNDYADNGNNELLRKIAGSLGIRTSLKTTLSTSNYEKGTIRWNGKANKALTEVIPTYLAKIEALLSGKSAKIYDYEAGAFVSAEDIKNNFDRRMKDRANSASFDMKSRFRDEVSHQQFNTVAERDQLQKDIDQFFLHIFKNGKLFNPNDNSATASKFGVSSKENFEKIRNMFANSPIGMRFMFNQNILKERDNYNKMMRDLEEQGTDLSLMLYNNSGIAEEDTIAKINEDIKKFEAYKSSLKSGHKDLKLVDQELTKLREKLRQSKDSRAGIYAKNSNNIFTTSTDKKGHNIFWYLENILVTMKNGGLYGGDSGYTVPYDESYGQQIQYERQRTNNEDALMRQRNYKNSHSKDSYKYINSADVANSTKYEEYLRVRKEKELLDEKIASGEMIYDADGNLRSTTFKERFNKAGFFGKFAVVSDALASVVQKPIDAMAKIMGMADKKLAQLIYGGKIKAEGGREFDGILGLISYHIKDTFTGLKDWFSEAFPGLFKGGKGKFDISKIRIFGKGIDDIKNGFGGFFKEFGKSMKDMFTRTVDATKNTVETMLVKAGITGRKITTLDGITTLQGQSIRDFGGSQYSTDDERIKQLLSSSGMLSANDQKALERYQASKNNSESVVIERFKKLAKNAGLNAEESKIFIDNIKLRLGNMSLESIGSGTRNVLKNLNNDQIFSMESLFGTLRHGANGALEHSQDGDRVITDAGVYSKLTEFMKAQNFTKDKMGEDYNISKFLLLQGDSNEQMSQLLEAVERNQKYTEEQAKVESTHRSAVITHQNKVTGGIDRIIYYLSKIAGEKTPDSIYRKITRENENEISVDDYIKNRNNAAINKVHEVVARRTAGIEQHANGARYITKSGITAISKGELIIPSDKNPFNPDRNKVNRSAEIANERRIIKEFNKGKTPYMNADGNNPTQEQVDAATEAYIPEVNNQEEPKSGSAIGKGITRAAEILSDNLSKAVTSLTGAQADSASGKKLKEAIDEAVKNSGRTGARMLAGSIGGSFAFGALALNPLIGASIGSGIALINSSDKFKEWFFGVEENGEFKGGILPPSVTNWIHQKGKDVGMYSLGGGVLGMLTDHPLIGLLIGSGIGVAKSSDRFREAMFGEAGIFDKEKQEKIIKGIKSTAIGAVGMKLLAPKLFPATTTPLGLAGQLILGGAIGFMAQSNKFQEMIFGRKDDATGKYEHGLLPALRHMVIDPLGRLVNGIEERTLSFLKTNIARPLKTFFEPLGRLKKKSGELLKEMFGKITDKIGGGISRGFSAAFRPMWDAIKGSAAGKVVKGALKTIQTITNPLKWLQLSGKVMGNLFGKMGMMNHLTTEEYDNRYGFFGKAAAKRKGSNTIETIENSDLTSEQYKKILGDLRLINGSRGETRDKEKEARRILQNKLRDSLGENGKEFERGKEFALRGNFDTDENGNLINEQTKAELNDLTLSAYRQRFVGRNSAEARLNRESERKALYAMLNNNSNEAKASIGMGIIRESANADEAIKKMADNNIYLPTRSVEQFKKRFDKYKRYDGEARGMTNAEWNAMTPEQQLERMRTDKSFDQDAVSRGIVDAARGYQSAGLAITDADALRTRLNADLVKLGINPDGLSSTQLEEVIRGQYKAKQMNGFFNNENYDPNEEDQSVEAVNNVNDTVESQTTKMIDLLERIASRLGDEKAREALADRQRYIQDEINAGASPLEAVMATNNALGEADDLDNSVQHHMAVGMKPNGDIDRSTARAQETKEASKETTMTEYIRNKNNEAVEKARNVAIRRRDLLGNDPESPLSDTIRAAAERQNQEQETKEGLFSRAKNKVLDVLNTPIKNPFKRRNDVEGDDTEETEFRPRFGNIFRRPVAANANGGLSTRDTLSAVSAGELIIDKSDEGFDNKLSNNKIWSFAEGMPTDPKKEAEKEERQNIQQEEMAKNMRLMRQSLASDEDVRTNKGKAPSFLSKMGGAIKNVLNPKKLFRKASMLAIGAGILLAPLLDKILGAVVPFVTDTLIPKISEALPGILDKIMKLVPSLLELIVNTLPKFINTLVTQTLPEVLKLLPSLITGAGDVIASLASSLPKILKPILDMLPATIKAVFVEIIPAIWEMIPELVNTLTNNIGDIVGSLAESLVSVMGSVIKNLPSILVNLVKGLGKASFSLVKGLFGGSGQRRKTKVEQKIDTRMELPTKAISNMAAAGRGKSKYGRGKRGKGKGPSVFSYAGSGITSFFKNLFKKKDNTSENEGTDENESAIETYTNGMSYLNGKQINPILAHISQNSDKYKNKPFNIPLVDKGITFGSDGCGVMSGTMVVNGLTGAETVTPEKVAAHAILTGNKAPGGGIKAKYFGEFFKKFGIDTTYHDMTNEETKATTKKNIINALKNNKPVILMGNDQSSTGKTPFPNNNHYVVATGISEDGSKIILNDPYKPAGGDVYDVNDVLDKTIVGIEASKNNAGLGRQSIDFTKKAETSNIYGKVSNTSAILNVKPIPTNRASTNLGKQFDPIAYQDLGNYNPMTVDEMNNFINYWAKMNGHDAFVGHGDVFIKAAEETGLDPRYILAHAATESAWGTSKLAREKGNYFGITAYNGDEYNSATNFGKGLDSIVSGAKWIKKNFYDNGQKSLYDMIYAKPNHRYAVYNDGSPNDYWVSTIASIMRKGPNAYTNTGDNSGSGGYFFSEIGDLDTAGREALAGAHNDRRSESSSQMYRSSYFSPYNDDYYANYAANPDIREKYSVDNSDAKLPILQYLYGHNFENALYQEDGDLESDTYTKFENAAKEVYKQLVINQWKKTDPNLEKHGTQEEMDGTLDSIASKEYSKVKDSLVDAINRVNGVSKPDGWTNLGEQAIHPFLWRTMKFDDVIIGKGKKRFGDLEFSKTNGANTLMREFMYNPAILLDDNELDKLVDKIATESSAPSDIASTKTMLTALCDVIKESGIQLTPELTEKLYKSPSIYKSGTTHTFAPFGSKNQLGDLSPLRAFRDLVRPDDSAMSKLDSQDDDIYKSFIETKATLSKDTGAFMRKASVGNITGYENEGEENMTNEMANAADNAGDKIIEAYSEGGESKEFSLLDFMRNIGSYFSDVFDIIADLLWGNGTWGQTTGKQGTSNLAAMRNNEFGAAPQSNNYSIITTVSRPDTFADAKTLENSKVIKSYTQMRNPNGGSFWEIPVFGRFKNTDRYLLADGYTIDIPKSKIHSGYSDVAVLDNGDTTSSSDTTKSTTIRVSKRPDSYGDASKSEVLRSFLNRYTPDSTGASPSWNLNVVGKNKDGSYLLEDGTTVRIPNSDIRSESSLVNGIPSFGFTQDGRTINELIGDGTNAADNFFINSFRNNGAPYASKTSTGPAYDTIGGTRLHSGIDYGTGGQNPAIFSPISGTVTRNTPGTGTGNYMIIKEDGKTDGKQRYHRFMHMNNSTPMFNVGDKVNQGDIVGYVGNTGYSSGAHLHYDIADETGLGGSSGKSAEYIEEHFAEPNAYLGQYFKNQGYTGNKIYNQSNSLTTTNTNTPEKGGEMIDLKNIYDVILTVVEYLSKISDNTGLIGEIVTLLTELDHINSDNTLTEKQKGEKTTKVRKTISDKAREYSMMLNSTNKETTGHSAMVKAMQFIAAQ